MPYIHTCYSIKPRGWILAKGYGFLSFAKTINKNFNKNLSGKYSQKLHAKESATDALKTTSKGVIQKTTEAAGDVIGNKCK